MKWVLLLTSITITSCAALQDNFLLYRYSKTCSDTTVVYSLPYEKGTSHWVAQGGYSFLSHHGNFAIDIKMKQGTKILAARSGVVTYTKESNTVGGIGKKYLYRGNGITIRHSDGTFAHYWHLQYKGALVREGDTVRQGQVIGLSGSTGYSAFPHLHFEVTRQGAKRREAMPVPFKTEKGAKFLQPLHWYKAV